jgi:hypothetical protein
MALLPGKTEKTAPHVTHAPAQAPNVNESAVKAGKQDEHAAVVTETKSEVKAETKLDIASVEADAFMLAPVFAEVSQPVNARPEKQVAMDTKVAQLHKLWISKGKPNGNWQSVVAAGVVATYFMEPQHSGELKALINRAVKLHDVSVRWGSSFVMTEERRAAFAKHGVSIDDKYVGREVISFVIKDKRERATSDGKTGGEVVSEKSAK